MKKMKNRTVLAVSLMTLAAAIGAAIESVPNFERIVRAISFKGIGDDAKGSERRFRILFALGVRAELSFKAIVELTGYSAGAISQDLARLEKKGLIRANRHFLPTGTRRTTYSITEKGKKNLKEYLDQIAMCIEFFEKEGG